MLKVDGLCKKYPSFSVKNISFHLPKGYIMGFIGMNGAGKTTTLKSILNLVKPDKGTVVMCGKDMYSNELELKQQVGFMLGVTDFYPRTRIDKLISVYKRFYKEWDDMVFSDLLKKFHIDGHKKICELSQGMKAKLGIAMALSHNAKLLILDEPTSGLDPIARDELLDVFRDVVEDGEKSILFSTHITSDLDKCADYIIFIRNGELVENDTKDNIIDKHVIVKGKVSDLSEDLKNGLISYKINAYNFVGLALKEKICDFANIQTEVPNLEDIMVYYNKEDAK